MNNVSDQYLENEWKPFFRSQMDYLGVPASKDTSKFYDFSVNLLKTKSYDTAVAYLRSLSREDVMLEGSFSRSMIFGIGALVIAAPILIYLNK